MIESAKQVKAIGLAWLHLKFALPDGSRFEIKGPYSVKLAKAVFELANQDDLECSKIAAENGHGGPAP